MIPKLAYIDHTTCGVLMAMELRERGIIVDGGSSLDDFSRRNDLVDYPALLYHPGVQQQHKIIELTVQYPCLSIAIVTSPMSGIDYSCSGITMFAYDSIDVIETWVRKTRINRSFNER